MDVQQLTPRNACGTSVQPHTVGSVLVALSDAGLSSLLFSLPVWAQSVLGDDAGAGALIAGCVPIVLRRETEGVLHIDPHAHRRGMGWG